MAKDPFKEIDKSRAGTSKLPQSDPFREIDKIRAGTSKLPQAPRGKGISQAEAKRQEAEAAKLEKAKPPAFGTAKLPKVKRGGFQNVADVISAGITGSDRIIATTDNRVFNTAAEYIANAPHIAALMLTGIGNVVKGISGAAGIGTQTVIGGEFTKKTIGNFASNTKTAQLTAKLLARILTPENVKVFKLAAIAGTIGTYPWAEWALGEAKEGIIFNTEKAIRTGDVALIQEVREIQTEIHDIETWEQIARFIPYANIAFAFGEKAKALHAQMKVNDKIMADEIRNIEEGTTADEEFDRRAAERREAEEAASIRESERISAGQKEQIEREEAASIRESERFKRAREEEAEQDKAATEFYNSERKKMLKFESEAAKAGREEEAKFWAAERAKQREKEAEDRQAIADFWILYRKTAQKIADNNRPSNLNFGLI